MSTATKSRPIRQCDWEVRAILDGRKTQTRRVVKGVPDWCLSGDVAEATETEMVVDGQMVRFVPKERQSSTNDQS